MSKQPKADPVFDFIYSTLLYICVVFSCKSSYALPTFDE